MQEWLKLFKSHRHSGVYTVKPILDFNKIEQSARSYDLMFFYIDLSGVTTKEGFLCVVSKALQFPSYFGMNWDAFEDSIIDFVWCPANGYVLLFDNLEEFVRNVPEELKTARSILKFAASFWKKQAKPFYVLLVEKAQTRLSKKAILD
jgi:RNAse (barnase) inhibitor barstar